MKESSIKKLADKFGTDSFYLFLNKFEKSHQIQGSFSLFWGYYDEVKWQRHVAKQVISLLIVNPAKEVEIFKILQKTKKSAEYKYCNFWSVLLEYAVEIRSKPLVQKIYEMHNSPEELAISFRDFYRKNLSCYYRLEMAIVQNSNQHNFMKEVEVIRLSKERKSFLKKDFENYGTFALLALNEYLLR